MTTEVTAAANGHSQARTQRDATAGGGPPVTGDRFAGDLQGTIERAFLRRRSEQGRSAAAPDHWDLFKLE